MFSVFVSFALLVIVQTTGVGCKQLVGVAVSMNVPAVFLVVTH
jgi:hypothetical protein